MAETTTMTVRLTRQVEAKLGRMAAHAGCPKSRLAAAVIAAYVEADAAEALGQAIAEADAGGPFYDHDDVPRYLDARARGARPPRPDAVQRP